MSKRVTAQCTEGCGDVRVDPGTLELWVSSKRPELSHYTFICSDCGHKCVQPASDATQTSLMTAGFPAKPYEPPEEIFDDDARCDGVDLTIDHLLDLILVLREQPTGVDPWA